MGGIAASTFSGYIERPLINSNPSPSKTFIHPGILAFLLSVGIGLCSGLLVSVFLRRKYKRLSKD